MKANELRIGNYVLKQSSKMVVNRDEIYKIENINLQSCLKYEPIPLTEKWLLDFGFEKIKIKTSINDFFIEYYKLENFIVYLIENSFEIELITNNQDQFNLSINPKKEVHKLQNLHFVLTGIELTIS